ncbi:MAG: hypothetical protein N3G20_04680, partial [Verrucomicrobiae bacterium]|nr:hypothetical protein [Verrucomicrobiae bacterium]
MSARGESETRERPGVVGLTRLQSLWAVWFCVRTSGKRAARKLVPWVGVLCAVCLPFPGAGQPTPYFRLRDVTLEYPGPSEDLTNLTELKVGWFGPTNLNDPLTGDLWWAASFALNQANARKAATNAQTATATRQFQLVPRWSADPWKSGVSLLAKMIYEEKPIALLGSVDSASTHLAEQIAAKAQLPIVSPIATDKTITLAGVSWVFACA